MYTHIKKFPQAEFLTSFKIQSYKIHSNTLVYIKLVIRVIIKIAATLLILATWFKVNHIYKLNAGTRQNDQSCILPYLCLTNCYTHNLHQLTAWLYWACFHSLRL